MEIPLSHPCHPCFNIIFSTMCYFTISISGNFTCHINTFERDVTESSFADQRKFQWTKKKIRRITENKIGARGKRMDGNEIQWWDEYVQRVLEVYRWKKWKAWLDYSSNSFFNSFFTFDPPFVVVPSKLVHRLFKCTY